MPGQRVCVVHDVESAEVEGVAHHRYVLRRERVYEAVDELERRAPIHRHEQVALLAARLEVLALLLLAQFPHSFFVVVVVVAVVVILLIYTVSSNCTLTIRSFL